ncbi:MAG: hypothetical protein KDA51_00375 [Planctomycetales bacterium]|nr:hypothetical protein [Planctomycetales bacterium]
MLSRHNLLALTSGFVCVWGCVSFASTSVWGSSQADGEDPTAVVTESSDGEKIHGLIDFARDVRPILTDKCLECHGPEEAKNDFRVDEAATLLSYIEPGNVADSSLWTDYLITDDKDMRMPPTTADHDRPLTAAELATIKLWIEEGGMWNMVSEDVEHEDEVVPASMAERVWRFQGLFHPATTHFPIALLTVSAGFVFLSFFRPDTCEPVAFHCLWIGALGAIVASAAGWSYAVYEGYGTGFSFDLFNSAIDRHRWLGVAVAVVSMILIPVAMYVRRTEDFGMRFIWFVGSLLLLAGVGLAGYQGGELTYGEGHYENEFVKLFPEAFTKPNENEHDADASQAEKDDADADVAETSEMAEESEVVPTDSSEEVVIEDESQDAEGSTIGPDESSEQSPQVDPPQADANDSGASSESAADPSAEQTNSNEASTLPPAVVQPAELGGDAPVQPKPAVVF